MNLNRSELVVTTTCITMLLLFGIRMYLANEGSILGIKLGMLQERIAVLDKENKQLHAQILDESSLQTMDKKAQSLGFTPAQYYFLSR